MAEEFEVEVRCELCGTVASTASLSLRDGVWHFGYQGIEAGGSPRPIEKALGGRLDVRLPHSGHMGAGEVRRRRSPRQRQFLSRVRRRVLPRALGRRPHGLGGLPEWPRSRARSALVPRLGRLMFRSGRRATTRRLDSDAPEGLEVAVSDVGVPSAVSRSPETCA